MNIRTVLTRNSSFFMVVPAFLWQFLFFYLPLAIIIMAGFLKQESGVILDRLTLEHYGSFIDTTYLVIICRSLTLALVNALCAVLCAYPIAYYLARMTSRFKNLFLFFLILPFWTNFLVQVYAWFFVLEKHGLVNSVLLQCGLISEPLHLLNTVFATYLVMLYCYLPFAIMPIYSIIEKLDKRMLEASYDLGATPWQTFYRIIIPLTASGIITGFFLVFIVSFGEFVIPALLGGGRTMYVGTLISHYFLASRNYYKGSAFTTASTVLLVLVTLCIYAVMKRFFAMPRYQEHDNGT